ncbi:MerR family transcriptional regulator [Cupriavidus necator]|uniref:MerR family DNA-binding transcriptional regulator n=1 Tax=Cupriavidus necator TaxID=106590 RepID=A0A367PBF4_CUPNE|nr:MerR family DNA-binding transcriptional regulator [Cupriavidus necator]
MQLFSIGELAQMLSVAVITLRRWHKAGKLVRRAVPSVDTVVTTP